MSEPKHTPGPWAVNPPLGDDFALGGDSCEVVAVNEDGMVHRGICICMLETDSHPDGVEWLEDTANARLIAAAPDMLEACRRALDYIASDGRNVIEEDVLRDAIRKATEGS